MKHVQYLPEELFNTKIGATHSLIIPEFDFVSSERCLILNPEGLQQNLETANIQAIKIIEDPNVACGVNITVLSEDVVGQWSLVSRGQRFDELLERRLVFTIRVEGINYALLESY